jgi:transposase
VVAHLGALLTSGKQDDALAEVRSLLSLLVSDNQRLTLDLARALRRHLQQTSEKVSKEQLSLLLERIDQRPPPPTPPAPEVSAAPGTLPAPELPERKGHGRRPLPAHLPRVVKLHQVPPADRACSCCGRERTLIDYEISETLDFVPGSLRVISHQREKLACRHCEESGVVIAPPAPKLVERGLFEPGFLAQVLVAKYQDHVPLTRLGRIFAREGVELASSTLSDIVAEAHEALEPLARRIQEQALASHVLQVDDTGIKVLDKDSPAGALRGHLWAMVGDQRWAAFSFSRTWEGKWPLALLRGRRGWMQADAYAGFDAIYKLGNAIEVGCWAHARRGLFECVEAGDARAAIGLEWIQRLYKIEADASDEGLDPEQRKLRREERSRPVLEALRAWLIEQHGQAPPKSPLARAIGYCIRQWEALLRFVSDGRVSIDNTACERVLRPIALGRRNYLFAGSETGACRAATMYSLLGSAALSSIEPWGYLRDVLQKLIDGWPQSRIDELLPPAWAAAHPNS